jgi:hypothetical protein
MYFTSRAGLFGLVLAGASLPLAVRAAPYFAYGQGSLMVYDSTGIPQAVDFPQNGSFATDPVGGTQGAQSQSYTSLPFGVTASQSAAADLQAGQLHASASLTQSPGAGQSVYLLGEAGFGDSFTALTPSGPFDWATGQARFTMTLDGSAVTSSLANGVRLWNVALTILKPGSLAAGEAFDPDARLGFVNFVDASYGGVGVLSPSASAGITASFDGNLASGLTLDASFNFGSDFDWMIDLGAGGGAYDSAGVGSLDVDLAHTLTVAYQGPDGTIVGSASGAFPGTVKAVVDAPEPASAALLLSGLLGIAAVARRRQPA